MLAQRRDVCQPSLMDDGIVYQSYPRYVTSKPSICLYNFWLDVTNLTIELKQK